MIEQNPAGYQRDTVVAPSDLQREIYILIRYGVSGILQGMTHR
jgi:hypothetical protein